MFEYKVAPLCFRLIILFIIPHYNIFKFLRNDSLTCINLPLVSRFFENLKESKLINNQKYNMQSKRQRNGQRMVEFLFRTNLLLQYRIKSNEFANQTAIARQTLARVH